jgi:hypothetical protein
MDTCTDEAIPELAAISVHDMGAAKILPKQKVSKLVPKWLLFQSDVLHEYSLFRLLHSQHRCIFLISFHTFSYMGAAYSGCVKILTISSVLDFI